MVIDASVALRWFVDGEHVPQALSLLERGESLKAPGHFLSEVANALFKLVRAADITRNDAIFAHQRIGARFSTLTSIAELHDEAFELCLTLLHPIYDCYYLALAMRTGDVFVTADQRFLRKLAGTRFAPHAMHLSEVAA